MDTNLDAGVECTFFLVELIVVVRVHLQVVESELFFDPLLECLALFQRQRVGFRDDGDDVDDIGQLFENDNVNGLKSAIDQHALVYCIITVGRGKIDVRMS